MRFHVLAWLLLLPIVLPESAFACDAPSAGLRSGSTHVAPDGPLTLLFDCGGQDCAASSTPPFKVLDSAGSEVPGSVSKSGVAGRSQWVVWQPTSPFAANAKYSAHDADRSTWYFDTSSPPFDPTSLQLTFQAALSSVGFGEEVCCQRSPFTMWCYGDRPCFNRQRQEAVALEVKVLSVPIGFDFLYRITFRAGAETTVLPDQQFPYAQFISRTAAKEYCYAVDAVRPATNEVIHVADGCQPLGLSVFAVRAPTDVELNSDLSNCAHAPPGYESDWKRLGLRDAFSDTPSSSGAPTTADASTANAPNTEVLDQGVPSDAVDAGSGVTQPSADGGCSLSGGGDAPGRWLMLLLALTLGRLTRCRSQAHRQSGLVVLLVLSVLALQPTRALACAPGTTLFQRGSSHVLPNGSLMLLFSCSYDCQPTPPKVKVLDSDAAVVSGKLVSLKTLGRSLWVAWRPTQPFVVGETYSALAEGAPWEFEITSTLPDPEPESQPAFRNGSTELASSNSRCGHRFLP